MGIPPTEQVVYRLWKAVQTLTTDHLVGYVFGVSMNWLKENTDALQALGAILTVVFAVVALAAIKLQIDASDKLQREQSARDMYREHLSLAIQNPTLAYADYCDLDTEKERLTYEAYLEHFLYTAEQLAALGAHWQHTIKSYLEAHGSYVCSRTAWDDYPADLTSLITQVRSTQCRAVRVCAVDD